MSLKKNDKHISNVINAKACSTMPHVRVHANKIDYVIFHVTDWNMVNHMFNGFVDQIMSLLHI